MQPFHLRRAWSARVAVTLLIIGHSVPAAAQAPPTKLRTKWAADVTPDRVLPEYPRPQMVRSAWQNLNGQWEYAIADAYAKELHARLSSPPSVRELVATSERAAQTWRYTTEAPAETWFTPAFDDRMWPQRSGGFGRPGTARASAGTSWQTPEIWIRRTFDLPSSTPTNPHLRIFHDDDAEVYLNGERIATLPGSVSGYSYVPLDATARAKLRSGANTPAIHVKQVRGGQFIDAGIVEVVEK